MMTLEQRMNNPLSLLYHYILCRESVCSNLKQLDLDKAMGYSQLTVIE